MPNTPCGCRVALDDVRDALGRPALDPTALEAAGWHIAPDWRGDASLAVADAAAYVAEQRASAEAQRADWQRQVAQREQAEREQHEQELAVYQEAHAAALAAGKGQPAANAAGHEAVQRAREGGRIRRVVDTVKGMIT